MYMIFLTKVVAYDRNIFKNSLLCDVALMIMHHIVARQFYLMSATATYSIYLYIMLTFLNLK